MKKLLLSLLALASVVAFSSCDNDSDDLPEVNIEVQISGGVQNADDNKIYIEQGTPLVVESLKAEPRNGTKQATLGLTTYYLNGIPQMQTVTVPFGATFDTSTLAPGEYAFQIKSAVYQVDKSAAFVVLTYALVVEAPDEDPDDTPGESTVTPDELQLAQQ